MLPPRCAVKGLFSVAVCLLASGELLPAAVLTDPFTDNNRSGGATDNSGITWYDRSANAQLVIADDSSGIGSGLALQWSKTIVTPVQGRGFLGVFDAGAFTLSSVGDSISVAFDFRFAATPGASASGLTFGLYNNNTSPTGGDDGTSSDNDLGYRADIGTGGTSAISLNREANSTPGGLGTTNAPDTTVLTISSPSTVNINDTLKHSALFSITRTASGVNLSVSVDNVLRGTASHVSSPTLNFHEIVFSQNSSTTYFIDNVVVTTVPEPSTALLSLFGALGIWLTSRRRNSA